MHGVRFSFLSSLNTFTSPLSLPTNKTTSLSFSVPPFYYYNIHTMGQILSIPSTVYNYYNPPAAPEIPLLPEVIQAKDIISHAAGQQVWKSLKERDEAIAHQVETCKDSVAEFFSLSEETKKSFELPYSTDPLLKGRRPNRGYIRGNAKEYMKIRLIDGSAAYPKEPAHLEEDFKNGMHAMRDIAFNALYCLGTVPVEGQPEKTCLDIPAVDNIKSFFPEGSSVSVIKYFIANEGTSDDHSPLGEHVDTGVMTLIRVSEVPGLLVFDQLRQEYLNLEELGTVGDMVLIMGRKIELLLDRAVKLEPTLHKVVIPQNKERFSILFFMDLPGGKDV